MLAWVLDHLPGIGGFFMGLAALVTCWVNYRRDERERIKAEDDRETAEEQRRLIAQSELDKIRHNVENEAQKLLDIRAAQISDNVVQLQELQAKVKALTEMYGSATLALQQAVTENQTLRMKLEQAEEREADLTRQIKQLRERITVLERLSNGGAT